MKTIEVKTLPQVRFAHSYHAAAYYNSFPISEDRMEITFVAEGSVCVECNGKKYVAQKGDILCIPYSPYQIIVKSSAYHEHHTVQAAFQWVLQDDTEGLYLPIVTPAHYNTKNAANLIEQLICNQLLFKDSPTRGAIVFLDLLYEIHQCNKRGEKLNVRGEALYTKRAKKYVQDNIHLPITQKSVAKHLAISPEYLCTIFKQNEGMTFMKYVNTEKLEAIKNLMEKEHLFLYEAATLFGYNDPNYVSRLFKKYYGYNITNKTTVRQQSLPL